MDTIKKLRTQYETFPYPDTKWFSRISSDAQSLQYPWLLAQAKKAPHTKAPRILVAGCGTLEPLVVAKANPEAQILAIDLSERSIAHLKRRLWLSFARKRVECRVGNFLEDLKGEAPFDLIICTGVIHHIPQAKEALEVLRGLLSEEGLLRLFVYSLRGRELLWETKELLAALQIHDPKQLARFIETLPGDHPLRIYFHLYSDTQNVSGIVDGYFHTYEEARSASGWKNLLEAAGLRFLGFWDSDLSPEALDIEEEKHAWGKNYRILASRKNKGEK